jgi:hypothetical protein
LAFHSTTHPLDVTLAEGTERELAAISSGVRQSWVVLGVAGGRGPELER